jgi:hypothetical protein
MAKETVQIFFTLFKLFRSHSEWKRGCGRRQKVLIKTGKREKKSFFLCTSNDAILSMHRKKHKQKKTWQMCQKENRIMFLKCA